MAGLSAGDSPGTIGRQIRHRARSGQIGVQGHEGTSFLDLVAASEQMFQCLLGQYRWIESAATQSHIAARKPQSQTEERLARGGLEGPCRTAATAFFARVNHGSAPRPRTAGTMRGTANPRRVRPHLAATQW